MKKNNIEISIIIVHYKVKKELFECIESVLASRLQIPYEIIVVDNDEEKTIETELLKKFPNIAYIPNENTGWGDGTNVGVKHARGTYLYFLNPDTFVYQHAIDRQYAFITTHKDAGIVSSLLIDASGKPYVMQGTGDLTPLSAVFSISIFNKLFPTNPISRRFWLRDWDKKQDKSIDVVPLSSALIKKDVFIKAKGFDKKFFLYFEEYDLSRKVRKLKYQNYIVVGAHVKHLWGVSSKKRNDISKIFSASRYYYFKKYYGMIIASIVEYILSFNKFSAVITSSIILAGFLRFFHLSTDMMFIGDFGWFYLSARDFILSGIPPLVGITASHTWLHQGPLWTYLLSLALLIGRFNPLSGAYVASVIGLLTVVLFYFVTKRMFDQKTACIASVLYATSPLIIIHSRMPYHTSPIPFFTVLFLYILYKWFQGNINYFPIVILTLGVLYNLELASISLVGLVATFLIYGYIKKKEYVGKLATKKNIINSIICFIIPMFPILLYDITNGFRQSIFFGGWLVYKTLQMIHLIPSYANELSNSWENLLHFSFLMVQRLTFLPSQMISVILFIALIILFVRKTVMERRVPEVLVLSTLFFLLASFIIARTPSEAYMPLFFPVVILTFAVSVGSLMKNRHARYVVSIGIVLIVIGNITSLLSNNYLMDIPDGYGVSYAKRLEIAKEIVYQSKGKRYSLSGTGSGSQFQSFTDNYRYLTWWMGNPPSLTDEKVTFIISETPTKVVLKKVER